MLDKVTREKGIFCKIIDTKGMSDSERYQLYITRAIVPSARKKYKIRQIFGSRKHSAPFFGKEAPALLVYEEGEKPPIDVYPHEKNGKRVEIVDFLQMLLRG